MIWLLPGSVRACRVEGKGHGIFFPPSLSWQGQRSGHFSSMVSNSPRRAQYGSSSHGRPFPAKATGQQDCLPGSHQPQDGRAVAHPMAGAVACCCPSMGCLCVFCLTSLTTTHAISFLNSIPCPSAPGCLLFSWLDSKNKPQIKSLMGPCSKSRVIVPDLTSSS